MRTNQNRIGGGLRFRGSIFFIFLGGIIDYRIWKNLYSSCLWYVPRFTSFSPCPLADVWI